LYPKQKRLVVIKNKLVAFFQHPSLKSWVNILFLIAATGFLVRHFYLSPLRLSDFESFLPLNISQVFYVFLVLVLFVGNYVVESLKWWWLSNEIQIRSFGTAFYDVIQGVVIGFFTPFMLGDFVGRSMSFSTKYKPKVIFVNLYNGIAQIVVAIFFGSISLGFWYFQIEIPYQKVVGGGFLLSLILFVLGLLVLFFFENILFRFTYLRNMELVSLPFLLKLKVLVWTVVKNILYNLQYILVFKIVDQQVSVLTIVIGTNLLLLIKTFGGSLNFLSDLSLKQLVSIYFFKKYGVAEAAIVTATFFIWFINICIPVVLGLFLGLLKNRKTWF
jgi:hypothetical protein